ncbi:MAG: polysaccharide biosynthesis C-terminal domain-containing protein [Oscillospiraceae bacterium]|nr:capsular biosynthesis protein [Ruminococcus sp.]MDE6707900.1 polysaccharide biosynthesis C-terminal domain-containing protein [Oscillospiraceae bacterium]
MNKYKKLASNTLVFAIGSFGSKILLLLLTRLYTANISSADNSTKSLLEQTANFIIPIATFSIAEAVIRYGLDREYNNKEVFTSACVTELIGIMIMLLFSPLLYLLPYAKGYVPLLLLYILASSFRQLNSQFVRARGLVRLFALDGILATLSLFIFNVIFISVLHLGVTGFMMAVMLSDFCSGMFLWIVASLGKFFDLRYYNYEITKIMLRFSIPMIPTAVLWIITGFSDRLFVRYMVNFSVSPDVGDVAAGVYDASSKVPNLISMVSTIFFQAWNMSAITENNSNDRSIFYYRIFSAYQSIMFLGASFMVALVKPLSNMLIDSSTDPAYARAYQFTPILIVGVLMMSLNQFLSSIYTATQKTSHSFWTSLIAAITNLILNVILIYQWGVQGAVIATFMSYFVCYVVRIIDTRKIIYFKVYHGRFACNLLVLFFMCIMAIKEPKCLIPVQVFCLIFMVVFNSSAILQTVKKLLKRG